MIQVQILGRTFMPVTEPIEFSFDAPTWSLGKSMAAHIAMGRIGEVYHKDLKDTIYQICGRCDEQWEVISTRKDRSIAAFIQELNQHIRRQENQMCVKEICPRGNNKVLYISLYHDKCLLFMLQLY